MTRLGLIARADQSGLGVQTWEVWRHLRPDATMVVNMGEKNRGGFFPHRFVDPEHTETRVSAAWGYMDEDEAAWLIGRSDVIYTAECCYRHDFASRCAQAGVRLVVHANPELWQADYGEHGTEVWTATRWRANLLPESAHLVPFPVATDHFTARARDHVQTLLHVGAPAMLDRNGAQLVERMHDHLTQPFTFRSTVGQPLTDDYWTLYGDADALVLPRRYAGLCLTMQEAAAQGMPLVMLETDANAEHTIPELRIPVMGWERHHMKGGTVEVYDAYPQDVARVVDRLADPDIVTRGSEASLAWTARNSWTARLPLWREALGLLEVAA